MREQQTKTELFEYGRLAALRGCWRILCNGTDEQRDEWLRGYDSVSRENRGTAIKAATDAPRLSIVG